MTSAEVNPLQRGRGLRQPEGILPITTSIKRDFVAPWDYRYEFLCGNRFSVQRSSCGKWDVSLGCLNHAKHSKFVKLDVVKAFKMSCGKLGCPVCYEKASAKRAIKIAHRISQFKLKGRKLVAIHLMVSPPKDDLAKYTLKQLRKKTQKIARRSGLLGGCLIFHHLRQYGENDLQEDLAEGCSWKTAPASWYLSPHFHIIGYGWIRKTKEIFEETGWIVRNLGARKNVRATALYQLSHCYVPEKGHSIIWFGALAYNQMRVKPLPDEDKNCPLCHGELRRIRFKDPEIEIIVKSNLETEGFYYVEEGLFEYVPENELPNGEEKPPWLKKKILPVKIEEQDWYRKAFPSVADNSLDGWV